VRTYQEVEEIIYYELYVEFCCVSAPYPSQRYEDLKFNKLNFLTKDQHGSKSKVTNYGSEHYSRVHQLWIH
jgi:hypothetical protein